MAKSIAARLLALEARQRARRQAAQDPWVDLLWKLIDAGKEEGEDIDQLLESVQRCLIVIDR